MPKVIQLSAPTIIDGRPRAAGEVVQVPDSFDETAYVEVDKLIRANIGADNQQEMVGLSKPTPKPEPKGG